MPVSIPTTPGHWEPAEPLGNRPGTLMRAVAPDLSGAHEMRLGTRGDGTASRMTDPRDETRRVSDHRFMFGSVHLGNLVDKGWSLYCWVEDR